MKIEKDFSINAPREQVWNFITSPERVAPCIPGCEQVTQVAPSKYQARIKVAVGPIKTVFNVDIQAVEERPPEYAAYLTKGEEGSRASRIKAESSLRLQAVSPLQTKVQYISEISVVGRLGKFGVGMMHKIADSMGDQFVEALRDRIEGAPQLDNHDTAIPVQATPSIDVRILVGIVMLVGLVVMLVLF